MKAPEPTLEDLFRPLSAKVMPPAAKFTIGGRLMTDQQALMSQRQSTRQSGRKGRSCAKEKNNG